MGNPKQLLDAIYNILPDENFVSGISLKLRELYIPPAHKKALQLYSNIVVGDRGVGKSTWTLALASKELRAIIGSNIKELEDASVHIGFAEAQDTKGHPDPDNIKKLLGEGFNPYDIWKTVAVRWLSHEINKPIPMESWAESISWVRDNPENCTNIFMMTNEHFNYNKKNGLILFDALDRVSDNWGQMDTIVSELLRLVLYMKPFSNIHAKVFLRVDQESRNIRNFPDSSKLLSTKTELTWETYDLHGLLWQQLVNASGIGGDLLRNYYQEIVGAAPLRKDDYWTITNDIKRDEDKQRALFEKLAGPWMGKDKRRGVPYVWSVSHLAGGKKRTSPRSFLNAIKTAAEDSQNRASDYPLYYESIKKGVRSASQIRVNEIAEDYPWIHDLCTPLAGMNVPALFSIIEKKWDERYPDGPNTIESAKLFPNSLDRGWIEFKKELVRLGVFQEMRDDRINMPDLFRVGFGLGRKGGVPPVE